jgi:hypothetical protein
MIVHDLEAGVIYPSSVDVGSEGSDGSSSTKLQLLVTVPWSVPRLLAWPRGSRTIEDRLCTLIGFSLVILRMLVSRTNLGAYRELDENLGSGLLDTSRAGKCKVFQITLTG